MSTLNFKEARLRANPAYELVMYDRLSAAEQQALRSLADDPDCYGILRPRADFTLSMKSVSRDVALLLFSLQSAGALPRFAAMALGEECDDAIGKMILDGVLEIELDGAMVSGGGAYAALRGSASATDAEGALAAMSRRAVEYAAALELTEPMAISARLYRYNTVPASRRWRGILPDEAAAAKYLGLADRGLADLGLADGPAGALRGAWTLLPDAEGWIAWHAKSGGERRDGGEESTYKLYVSPACERVGEAMEAVAAAIARSNAFHFKVGRDIHGLLRPDKMVVYFRRFADLQETGLTIAEGLPGCPAQGVPFTAELAGGGLLSWGMDPANAASDVSWRGAESWRVKICNRLALALAQSGRVSGEEAVAAAEFALQRLRMEGVDTTTWTPSRNMVWSN